jgi:protein gp37
MRVLRRLGRRWPDNAWVGTSIGHPCTLPLLKPLLAIPAEKHFLSNEPLLADLAPYLDVTHIDWGIVGGENASSFHPIARPCHLDWVRGLRDLYLGRGKTFFFKQWGIWANNPTPRDQELDPKSPGGATLDGRLWREWP